MDSPPYSIICRIYLSTDDGEVILECSTFHSFWPPRFWALLLGLENSLPNESWWEEKILPSADTENDMHLLPLSPWQLGRRSWPGYTIQMRLARTLDQEATTAACLSRCSEAGCTRGRTRASRIQQPHWFLEPPVRVMVVVKKGWHLKLSGSSNDPSFWAVLWHDLGRVCLSLILQPAWHSVTYPIFL